MKAVEAQLEAPNPVLAHLGAVLDPGRISSGLRRNYREKEPSE